MPLFVAVRCYQCKAFQVKPLRKDKKFSCVVCGAKQSIRKVLRKNESLDRPETFNFFFSLFLGSVLKLVNTVWDGFCAVDCRPV